MFIKKGWINRNRILMQGSDFLYHSTRKAESK